MSAAISDFIHGQAELGSESDEEDRPQRNGVNGHYDDSSEEDDDDEEEAEAVGHAALPAWRVVDGSRFAKASSSKMRRTTKNAENDDGNERSGDVPSATKSPAWTRKTWTS